MKTGLAHSRSLVASILMGFAVMHGALADSAACGGGPGVFNVFSGGKVTVNSSLAHQDSDAACNVDFSSATGGSSWVNVGEDDLYGPTQQPCDIQATDVTMSKLTLPPFPTTASAPDIKINNWNSATSGFYVTYDGVSTGYNYCNKPGGIFWVANGDDCKKTNAVTSTGALQFPVAGDPASRFTFTGTSFGTIEAWSAPITFSGTGDITIDHLFSQNQTHLDFPGGHNYFIKTLELNDNFTLTVSGQGGAKLYINAVTNFHGSGSCVNINGACDGNNSSVSLDGQNPERLALYVYSGNLELSDRTQIAASIYVHDGDLIMAANSNFSLIGEAVAENIAIKNSANRMRYQDTGAFNSIYPDFSSGRVGLYSPARIGEPEVSSTGDLSFMVYQSDYSPNSSDLNYGTLRAFAKSGDGKTETTHVWDANERMIPTDRGAKLYVDVGGTMVASNALSAINLTAINAGLATVDRAQLQARIADGPVGSFPTQWSGRIGKPGNTQPVIFNDIVLFSSSEGVLYAVDRDTGALRWGWLLGDFMTGYANDAAYTLLLNGDGMKGQINAVSVGGVNYVLGTAQGGSIHYALQLDATTGLPSLVWKDVRLGQRSPNAEKPLVVSDQALYVVGDKLVIRPIAGGTISHDAKPNLGGSPVMTSSPTIINNNGVYTLYVGTSNGYVWSATPNTSNWNPGTFSQVKYTGIDKPLTYVVYSKTVDHEYLTAQSAVHVTTIKRKVNTTSWTKIWTTTLGSSSEWDFKPGAPKGTIPVPALPDTGEITDRVTSVGGYISIPFTIPSASDSCDGTARLYLAPLDPTWSYYAIFYLGHAFNDSYLSIGTGMALSAQATYLDGRMMLDAHSEKNMTGAQGMDNPIEFRPIPPNKGPGRKSWREIILQ